ncbi:hypothetical protein DM860_012641 [Cuscuta australis]|uniref:F-box domain-containing protein n=1 Tax=Cuscuta australis TaxID=267555 RepID=A0A328DE25_9ASTE|nr:hypothetical protein DM860_012641 [Cuscuta australis]
MADTPTPNPKRCCGVSQDPSKLHFNSHFDLDRVDSLLHSFLGLSSSALDLSFDRLLDSSLCASDQCDAVDGALRLGSALLEAGKRASRGLAASHNASVWPLSSDITIKIFSLLGTRSVCYASATCSFFHKCAADPACYADIDLVTPVPRVNNLIVATMIQRAGKAFRSLKLGIVPSPMTAASRSAQPLFFPRLGKEASTLTRSCLAPLSSNDGTIGSSLRRLHLCNIERLDDSSLNAALSVCSSLRDLEVVGLNVDLSQTIGSISKSCPLIERLFFESSKAGRDCSFKLQSCSDLVSNCPNISSLALRGYKLHDSKVRVLFKGFHKLKYVDFSTSYSVTGSFLKNLGGDASRNVLEVLILRDCMHLKEVEIARFFSTVIAGDFKHLKHIDISNREGLASEVDWYERSCSQSFIPFQQLMEARPGLCLLAEFPHECELKNSSSESSFSNSSNYSSDALGLSSSTEWSYTSEGSSDEVDFAGDALF